jgi:hypothetical protein
MISEFAPAPSIDLHARTAFRRSRHSGTSGRNRELQRGRWPGDGLFPPDTLYPQTQRGYRSVGPPNAASAFQLWCNAAGFFMNSRQFSRSAPVTLAGQA